MQNTIRRRTREQFRKQRLSKRNKTYQNQKKYISELDNSVNLNNNYSEKDFAEILQIFDFICKKEVIENDFSEIKDNISLYKSVNSFANNTVGNFTYDKEHKHIECSDIGLRYVSKSIMTINTSYLYMLKNYVSKDFCSYIFYFLKDMFLRSFSSNHFEWWLEENPSHIESMLDEEDNAEDIDFLTNELHQAKSLLVAKNNVSSLSSFQYNVNNFNSKELEMYKVMEELIAFDNNVLKKLIEPEDIISCMDESALSYEGHIEEYSADAIINEFYEGYYVLTWEEKESGSNLIQSYVEYINSLENESLWYFNISGRCKYTKNKAHFSAPEKERNLVVNRLNNVLLINKLSKNYYYDFSENS